VRLDTTLANLRNRSLVYDLADNSLQTDYTLHLPDLGRLQFLTKQRLKGKLTLTGKAKVAGKSIEATAHSDTLGGAIDALFKNGKAGVTVKGIQTVALTDMLGYPHIFDSKANMQLDFNTLNKKGSLHAELLNGQILPNKMTFLLRQMANFDITREIYERTTLDTKIDDKILRSNLHMKSRLTEIDSQDGLIDLDKQKIDTTIRIKLRQYDIPVVLTGSLASPNVKIDAKALMKGKAKEELQKHLPKELKNSPAGGLLKNLF
jgi:hypothetical protein